MNKIYERQTKAIYKNRTIVRVPAGYMIVPLGRYRLKTTYRTLSDATNALDRWQH